MALPSQKSNKAPLLDRHEPRNFNPINDPAAPAAGLGVLRRPMTRLVSILVIAILATSCASQYGRVVTTERLSRFENGGSLSTIWYYGSDDNYHYFRHLFKSSTPYRLKKSEFQWSSNFAFAGYIDGKLVRHELSDQLLKTQGITILDRTRKALIIQILDVRGGKDNREHWDVDTYDGSIRIQKSRTDGKVFVPGSAVEFWDQDKNGQWTRAHTA